MEGEWMEGEWMGHTKSTGGHTNRAPPAVHAISMLVMHTEASDQHADTRPGGGTLPDHLHQGGGALTERPQQVTFNQHACTQSAGEERGHAHRKSGGGEGACTQRTVEERGHERGHRGRRGGMHT